MSAADLLYPELPEAQRQAEARAFTTWASTWEPFGSGSLATAVEVYMITWQGPEALRSAVVDLLLDRRRAS